MRLTNVTPYILVSSVKLIKEPSGFGYTDQDRKVY